VNEAASNVFGYSRDEFFSMNIFDLAQEFQAEKWPRLWEKLKIKRRMAIQGTARKKDGTMFAGEVTLNYLEYEGKQYNLVFFTDITDRVRIEDALRQSEERYRNVYDTAPIAFIVWDRDCRITGWNRQAEIIFGWSREESLGRNFFDLIIPESERSHVKGVVDQLLKGTLTHSINENLTKDGQIIICEWNNSILRDRDGAVIGVTSLGLDITKRQHAEEQLVYEKNLMDSVINALPGVFCFFDEDGHLVFWNKNTEKISGYGADELQRLNAFDLIVGDEREMIVKAIADVFQNGRASVEVSILSKDGKMIPYYFQGIRFESGGKRYVLGSGLDMTERKWIEEELKKKERFLYDVFTSIQDGISILDTNFVIQRVNPVMEKWYAHAMPLVGRKCFEVYHGRNKRCEVCPTHQAYSSGKPAYEVVPKTGPGGEVQGWQDLYSFPIFDTKTGELKGVVEYVRDITERKKAEDALIASEANYRAIFNAANDAIFIHDPDTGAILDVNQKMCDLYGYSVEEARGLHIEDLSVGITPYTQNDAVRLVRAALKEGPQLFEWHAKDRAGRLFWVEVNLKQAVIGGQLRILAVVRDITERKRADELIRESEKQWRNIFNATVDGILLADTQTKKFYLGNDAVCRMLGYTSEEIVQMGVEDIHPKAALPAVLDKFERQRRHEIRVAMDIPVLRKDGSVFFADVTSEPITIRGRTYLVGVFHDVTERRKAEETIRRSEEHYRLMVEGSEQVFFYLHDADHRFIFLSSSISDVLGYKPEEMLGHRYEELLAGEPSNAIVEELTERALRTGKRSPIYTAICRCKDGRRIVLELVETPIVREDGTYIHGFARDITERKKAEDALRESQERYRRLVDALPDVIYDLSGENETVRMLNPAFEKVTGWSRKEWLNKSFVPLIHPDDVPLAYKTFKETMSGKSPPLYELRIRLKSGAYLICEFTSIPHIEGGKVVGEFGIVRDITERKRAEDALKESEERYRSLVDTLPDVIFSTCAATGTLTSLNPAFEKVTGWSRKEWIGRSYADLVHPDDLPTALEMRDLLLNGESPPIYELRIRSRSGEYLVGEFTVTPQIKDGNVIGAFGIVRDITERKKIEEMKENLIRDASHELKTPVAMAEMAFAMCERALKENDMARFKVAHRVADSNIKRIRKDIDNILTSYALKTKKKAQRKSVSLRKIVDKIVKDMEYIIEDKKLKLNVDIPLKSNKVFADAKEIGVLFHNIIDNAIKFTERGRVSISSQLKGNRIYVRVKDDGVGIGTDGMNKIFDPFYKESSSMPGTGLGLSICREIVERNDGRIEAVSKGKGKGTTIIVELPASRS
jgi:PAS domain S-box-containing protein